MNLQSIPYTKSLLVDILNEKKQSKLVEILANINDKAFKRYLLVIFYHNIYAFVNNLLQISSKYSKNGILHINTQTFVFSGRYIKNTPLLTAEHFL